VDKVDRPSNLIKEISFVSFGEKIKLIHTKPIGKKKLKSDKIQKTKMKELWDNKEDDAWGKA
jgi:hypothetical protein